MTLLLGDVRDDGFQRVGRPRRSGDWQIAGLSGEDEIRCAMPEIELTPEQADLAERIVDILSAKVRAVERYLVRLKASYANGPSCQSSLLDAQFVPGRWNSLPGRVC